MFESCHGFVSFKLFNTLLFFYIDQIFVVKIFEQGKGTFQVYRFMTGLSAKQRVTVFFFFLQFMSVIRWKFDHNSFISFRKHFPKIFHNFCTLFRKLDSNFRWKLKIWHIDYAVVYNYHIVRSFPGNKKEKSMVTSVFLFEGDVLKLSKMATAV